MTRAQWYRCRQWARWIRSWRRGDRFAAHVSERMVADTIASWSPEDHASWAEYTQYPVCGRELPTHGN